MSADFIIALITNIKPLGFVILPYVAEQTNDKFITVRERITDLNKESLLETESPVHEFVRLTEEFSNQNLTKQFSKKKITPKDFIASLDKKLIKEHISPFVERRLVKIIHLIISNNIPLYKHATDQNLYEEDKILIPHSHALSRLHFLRTGDGTEYRLEVSMDKKQVKLNAPGNILLVNEPCWYITGNHLLHFDESITGNLLKPFSNKEVVNIPQRMEKQYYGSFIRKVAGRCEIEANGFSITDYHYEPVPVLSLEKGWDGWYILVLSFRYGDKYILANNKQRTFTTLKTDEDGFAFNRFRRNFTREKSIIDLLERLGLKRMEAAFLLNNNSNTIYNDFSLIEWLSVHKSELQESDFVIQQPSEIKFVLEVPELKFLCNISRDWFDLNATVIIGEFRLPFLLFKDHILGNQKEFKLPDGEIFLIPDEWFSQYTDLMQHIKKDNQHVRLAKHHFRLLDFMEDNRIREYGDKIFRPEVLDVPPLKEVRMRHYQLEGYYWLSALQKQGFGGILADDMGLGKTLQTIALLSRVYPEKPVGNEPESAIWKDYERQKVIQLDLFSEEITSETGTNTGEDRNKEERPPASLIVVPASLVHNWLNEIHRFAPWLNVYVQLGPNRRTKSLPVKNVDIILLTYGTLRNDLSLIASYQFTYIVLDESQTINNPESKVTQAIFTIQSKYKLALSGTPIQNSLSDIWSQFNFLNPGLLESLSHFMNHYGNKLLKSPTDPAGEKLKNLVKPYILRRTKEDVAPELPAVTETVILCDMTEGQEELYRSEKSKMRNLLVQRFEQKERRQTSVYVLKALMLLRQIANHPKMVDKNTEEESGKFNELTDMLETALCEEHKVLIFSSFVSHLKLVEGYLQDAGHKYTLLTGKTTHREKVINQFRKDKNTRVFLISLKAGGVGLNLFEADYVFLLDPWWNVASENQALNRAHRIGQDKKVMVYRFITKDTVEERIQHLQKSKQLLADMLVSPDQTLGGMSKDEILTMFD